MSNSLKINDLIKKIASMSGHEESAIRRMINEQIELMDNMVTEEGAAYVVADELNISIDSDNTTQAFTIDKLIPGQSNVTVIGRV